MNDYANITQITLLVRRLDIGTKVIRVRQHSQENQLFKYRKYLSYPPKEKVKLARANTVSYTHLTLPTKLEV